MLFALKDEKETLKENRKIILKFSIYKVGEIQIGRENSRVDKDTNLCYLQSIVRIKMKCLGAHL